MNKKQFDILMLKIYEDKRKAEWERKHRKVLCPNCKQDVVCDVLKKESKTSRTDNLTLRCRSCHFEFIKWEYRQIE